MVHEKDTPSTEHDSNNRPTKDLYIGSKFLELHHANRSKHNHCKSKATSHFLSMAGNRQLGDIGSSTMDMANSCQAVVVDVETKWAHLLTSGVTKTDIKDIDITYLAVVNQVASQINMNNNWVMGLVFDNSNCKTRAKVIEHQSRSANKVSSRSDAFQRLFFKQKRCTPQDYYGSNYFDNENPPCLYAKDAKEGERSFEHMLLHLPADAVITRDTYANFDPSGKRVPSPIENVMALRPYKNMYLEFIFFIMFFNSKTSAKITPGKILVLMNSPLKHTHVLAENQVYHYYNFLKQNRLDLLREHAISNGIDPSSEEGLMQSCVDIVTKQTSNCPILVSQHIMDDNDPFMKHVIDVFCYNASGAKGSCVNYTEQVFNIHYDDVRSVSSVVPYTPSAYTGTSIRCRNGRPTAGTVPYALSSDSFKICYLPVAREFLGEGDLTLIFLAIFLYEFGHMPFDSCPFKRILLDTTDSDTLTQTYLTLCKMYPNSVFNNLGVGSIHTSRVKSMLNGTCCIPKTMQQSVYVLEQTCCKLGKATYDETSAIIGGFPKIDERDSAKYMSDFKVMVSPTSDTIDLSDVPSFCNSPELFWYSQTRKTTVSFSTMARNIYLNTLTDIPELHTMVREVLERSSSMIDYWSYKNNDNPDPVARMASLLSSHHPSVHKIIVSFVKTYELYNQLTYSLNIPLTLSSYDRNALDYRKLANIRQDLITPDDVVLFNVASMLIVEGNDYLSKLPWRTYATLTKQPKNGFVRLVLPLVKGIIHYPIASNTNNYLSSSQLNMKERLRNIRTVNVCTNGGQLVPYLHYCDFSTVVVDFKKVRSLIHAACCYNNRGICTMLSKLYYGAPTFQNDTASREYCLNEIDQCYLSNRFGLSKTNAKLVRELINDDSITRLDQKQRDIVDKYLKGLTKSYLCPYELSQRYDNLVFFIVMTCYLPSNMSPEIDFCAMSNSKYKLDGITTSVRDHMSISY